ncbi:hypothetical protein HgNV_065 [Homarus gammarus nudivirus]|uniref:Uncharacterized protein n=1 Tax=Homarus gammarus nudivirus TaxID=2509616 RepID=A0A411HB79_9VIRU|nr:hypothetical protein KM727_gp65 [Homarus gammarus nudivirus]QBB28670.1 hypothetical protein HgNV_065 [Homarus gammarus nudivirus]
MEFPRANDIGRLAKPGQLQAFLDRNVEKATLLKTLEFNRDRVGLLLSVDNVDISFMDLMSRLLCRVPPNACRVVMIMKNEKFILYVQPHYNAYWINTMMSLKTYLTCALASVIGDEKTIKLTNNRHVDYTYTLKNTVDELLKNEHNENTTCLVVYNDDHLGNYLSNNVKCQVLTENMYTTTYVDPNGNVAASAPGLRLVYPHDVYPYGIRTN